MSGSISEVVGTLEARGIRFRVEGDKVKAVLPKPAPPDIIEAIDSLRPHRAEVRAVLESKRGADCGSPDCGGCYEVEPGRRIHPPKPSPDWLTWLRRWQSKGELVQ